MKKSIYIVLFISILILTSCREQEEHIVIEDTGYEFKSLIGQEIPIDYIDVPYSQTEGQLENFINIHKPKDINPIYFISSDLKSHQVIFGFENIYPMSQLTMYNPSIDEKGISKVSIYTSIDGQNYQKLYDDYPLNDNDNVISLDNQLIKTIKVTFIAEDQPIRFTDIGFILGSGYIVKEEQELSDAFLRYNGWTGADGIFSFDMNNGGDQIGVDHETTGFVFSDTFVGEVYENNKLRKTSVIINNSFGYLTNYQNFNRNQLSFDYPIDEQSNAVTPIVPDAYTGTSARNLLSNDGLYPSYQTDGKLENDNNESMWLSNHIENEIHIEFSKKEEISEIFVWNYNDTTDYGTKRFELSWSIDGINYNKVDSYDLEKASGFDSSPYQLKISLNQIEAKYLKFTILESYDDTFVGLGKILILDSEEQFLFGEATALYENENVENDESSRLWIQDGVIIDEHLYAFPILVKDTIDLFEVTEVSMIEIPIENQRFNYEETKYLNTSLMSRTNDGGVIYYGAGLMDHSHVDGYIYIYGYKDLNGRHLVVGRFLPQDILNQNNWQFYNGETWTRNINESQPLIEGVSAELSVTYMEEGPYAGKYMLVVMEDTQSGKISYSLSNTPYGPFETYQMIYQTNLSELGSGVFPYNAKMHPNLSTYEKIIISYNVNTIYVGQLSDARIYYPRFISLTPVKEQ